MSQSIFQVIVSALTLGGIYAITAIGIALLWGVMGMLNMAQGLLMAVGAYASVLAVTHMGLPWFAALPIAALAGATGGWAIYHLTVRWMLKTPNFETNIIIATVGLAIAGKSAFLLAFSGYQRRQPFGLPGGIYAGGVFIPYQTILIAGVTILLMLVLMYMLRFTKAGMAIRATAQNRYAAALMGIPAQKVFLQVVMGASALAAISGILVSSLTNVSPSLGDDTMLKAFLICVVAGLGNVPGAIFISFALALVEVAVQYTFSAKWGFPAMLLTAVIVLIWRPAGVFGREQIIRS